MNIVTFRGYGVGGHDVSIAVSRITHWERIDYNGRTGTCIYLDTGVSINVGPDPWSVEKSLRAVYAAARREALEEAAKVCDKHAHESGGCGPSLRRSAAAIRARAGETT